MEKSATKISQNTSRTVSIGKAATKTFRKLSSRANEETHTRASMPESGIYPLKQRSISLPKI